MSDRIVAHHADAGTYDHVGRAGARPRTRRIHPDERRESCSSTLVASEESVHTGDSESSNVRSQSNVSRLRPQLRQATARLHHRVEDQLQLLDAELSLERYSRILEVFLGFYAPVEAGLFAGPSLEVSLRDRSELLRCDLVALGRSRRDVANLPRCTELPRLASVEDAAGCLYVVEGACLGGQVVARAVNRRLGISIESGGSFFVGDGNKTSLRWATVLAWLEGFSGTRTEHVVRAACETFETLSRWIARPQS